MPKSAQVIEGQYINKLWERRFSEVEITACAFSAQMTVDIGSHHHLVSFSPTDSAEDPKILDHVLGPAEHNAQALHYLTATGLWLALLLNFGTRSLQFKRIIR